LRLSKNAGLKNAGPENAEPSSDGNYIFKNAKIKLIVVVLYSNIILCCSSSALNCC